MSWCAWTFPLSLKVPQLLKISAFEKFNLISKVFPDFSMKNSPAKLNFLLSRIFLSDFVYFIRSIIFDKLSQFLAHGNRRPSNNFCFGTFLGLITHIFINFRNFLTLSIIINLRHYKMKGVISHQDGLIPLNPHYPKNYRLFAQIRRYL